MKFRVKKRYQAAQRKHIRRFKMWSRHPFAVPFVLFLALIVLGAITFKILAVSEPPQRDAKVVIISHDHVQQTVPSIEPTVGALLSKLKITLNEGDVVEPALDTPIVQDDFRINIYRAVPVEITDGVHRTYTFSADTTGRSIAAQANVTVNPEDNVAIVPAQNFVTDMAIGQRVVIDHALPVTLNLYGDRIATRTHAKTVGQLLSDKNVQLKSGDNVVPSADTTVTAGMQVYVIRKGVKVVTQTVAIPMPVDTIQDSSLAYGTSAVRQHGSNGKKVVTYQIHTENGHEVSRTELQSVITVQPVTQIVVVGTNLSGIKGDMALAGIQPSDYQYADYIISHESGWCPTKWQGEYGSCPAYHGAPTASYIGYGLCQATPGYKMESAGSDWATNPITQLRWCSGYATARYGTWYYAYLHWLNYHNW
ncbi:MAG TPA: G5 domain-containing protein [Candidatus Saccharimonadales bacterium]|nr:G5 domain-containing protein [Candidatus Saccharimonadales bacterium]